MKMLCIRACRTCTAIEICCPNMEKLELLGEMEFSSLKFKDLLPSVSATLDFEIVPYDETEVDIFKFVKEILLQVQHVNELSLGPWILMILSQGAARDEPCLPLNSKCLTVIDSFLETRVPGFVFLLLSFPVLEKFRMQLSGGVSFQMGGLVKAGKKFWELNESLFSCLMSSLKTVEIESLSCVRSEKYGELLKFAKFILKNARLLERMVLLEQPGQEMDFANEICQKLSGVRKSSPLAIVEVARLPSGYMHSSLEYDWSKIAY